MIEEEADRLSALVDGLLEMSQLNAGVLQVEPEFNTVDDLIGAALQPRGNSAARSSDRDRHRRGRDDRGPVRLLAIRFASSSTCWRTPRSIAGRAPIAIGAERRDGEIRITISDRGPGVAASERDRIFEPFYRVPGATPDVRGAGLGLSIARRLAEAQGGALAIYERHGGGSTFVLSPSRRGGARRVLLTARARDGVRPNPCKIFMPPAANLYAAFTPHRIAFDRADGALLFRVYGERTRIGASPMNDVLYVVGTVGFLCAHARLRRGLRQARPLERTARRRSMTLDSWIAARLRRSAVLIYLIYTLLRPEKF